MNLQENIDRIQSMMGVINEDNRPNVIRKMVDDIGLKNTINMVGDYYMIEPYLKEIDKVNYIKERVRELGDASGVDLYEIGEEPIIYGEEDGEIHQIESLGNASVNIRAYQDMGNILYDYYVKYESLPSHIIELLVEILLNH
jgi:hypothetical protein